VSGDFPALGFDPAPGDLDGVTDLAGKYRVVSRDLGEADDSLRRIVTKKGIWEGAASEAFARRIGPLPAYLEGAARSMGQAADALEGWCQDLGELQRKAKDLEQRASAAARAAEEARANPDFALADRTFTDAESLRLAQSLLDNAGQRLQEAIDGCTSVQEAAERLLAQHTEAAQRVASLLRAAKELAPDEPDLLDKLVDGVSGALVDLADTASDMVDDAWNLVQDHAEVLSKASDVIGDIGNVLGVASDCMPDPVGEIVGAVATGIGLGALGGHAVAMAAGADVAPETLVFDAAGAVTSLIGVVPGVPDAALKAGTYSLLHAQLVGEVLGGTKFESPIDDFKNYWVPKDGAQLAVAGSALFAGIGPWAGVAMGNAVKQGIEADNAPDRRRERAEDEAWS
jgi:hypothetical protein